MFPLPKGKPEFSKLEESILQYWKENKSFEKSVESRPAENPYRFYDGPPFITGTPHYGTLMSSIIKDLIPRYQTMLGKRVERVWGWDCHGLPIEQKVQKKLGLESNKEIEESAGGIQGFIDECYAYTRDTSAEWSWYIDHIGRWVDMDGAYRTMDQNYMESVMWVFGQIWEKGYIYEGKRVSWYSWKLSTPISNFEIAMDDSYQDVQDPAITVKFPLTQNASQQDEIQGGKFEYTDDGYLRYVLAVIRNGEGEVLMLQNKKHGNRWQCPGGKIDAGETAEIALKREIKEELGVDIEIVSHLGNRKTFTSKTLWQGEYFEVKVLGEPVIQEPEKHTQMQWMKIVEDTELVHGYYLQYGEHVITEELNQMYDALALRSIAKGLPELKSISILAWTTTPWTIPMHMALAVNKDLSYVFVQSGDEGFLVAKNRLETVFKGKEYTIITDYSGSFLVGKTYTPPFNFYLKGKTPFLKGENDSEENKGDLGNNKSSVTHEAGQLLQEGAYPGTFRVYHADFVTDTDGTGIAHEAPEFGDVDFQLAKQEGIHITSAIDEAGKYTAEIPDYQGQLYLDCIDPITERLKTEGTLFKKEGITHRVPYCPRSNTPLIQKAQKSWFIDIQRIKSELIAQNESINWFPDHFKHGRFLKSLESAPDWCISRSRFWGTPMPVWQNADGSERVVINSREELYQRNKSLGQITKLVVLRHAQSDANIQKCYDDTGESPLSDFGGKQAQELVEKLKKEGVEVIISSPFKRTVQTITPFSEATGISIETMTELQETQHGKYANCKQEGDDWAECRKRFGAELDYKFGDTGESQNDLRARGQKVIDYILAKYPGKTVAIVSHGFPVRSLEDQLGAKTRPGSIKNCEPRVLYLDHNTGRELNLHRPYIDRIYVPGESYFTPKKVLGVHGWTSSGIQKGYAGKWLPLQDKLKAVNIQFDVPDFDKNKETKYSLWRDQLDTLDVASYDTIMATSFGCPVIMQYLCEKNIKLKRLVLVAPSGLVGNEYLEKVMPEMTEDVEKLRGLVEEIIIPHSEDDDSTSARFEYGRALAKRIGATFLPINGVGHKFGGWSIDFLFSLIQHGAPLRRIPEVLDVWMDSASMPYAQVHYPFENQEKMEASFPADFIAEYTGQIRAWFYVMHAIGVMVKGSPAFKNVAVTGVINGTDGRKMSKSFGNYPDPRETIEKYGADAIRFYLMGGTLMKGEDMTFSEAGIQESIKRVLLPLWNSYTFFATYANIDEWIPESKQTVVNGKQELPVYSLLSTVYSTPKTHELDTWIISRLHTLIQDVRTSMDSYDLQKTCDAIMVFLDGLNNWYIRRNRRRFWRSELDADKKSAYETLHEVLVTMTKLLAPICPFITEFLYSNLMGGVQNAKSKEQNGGTDNNNPQFGILNFEFGTGESVHLTFFPQVNDSLINLEVNQKMTDLQNLTNLGLAIRGREKLRVRQPLRAATITLDLDESARETLAEELNVKEVHTVKDVSEYVTITYSPDAKKIGATERKQWMKQIIADAKAGKGLLTNEGTLELAIPEAPEGKVVLAADEFEAVYTPREGSTIAFAGSAGYVIGLDTTLDEELTLEGYARDMIRGIQDARKELGFEVTDRLQLSLTSENDMLTQILTAHQGMIEKETLTTINDKPSTINESREIEIDEDFVVQLTLNK